MTTPRKVLILGAGVAGAILARRLSALPGLDVTCLERVAPDDHSEAGTGLNVGPNAIKALHKMKVRQATQALHAMLQDARPEHRISAMWALRQIGWWQLLNEVGRIAKEDQNLRVRRYALAVLRTVAEMVRLSKAG